MGDHHGAQAYHIRHVMNTMALPHGAAGLAMPTAYPCASLGLQCDTLVSTTRVLFSFTQDNTSLSPSGLFRHVSGSLVAFNLRFRL